MSVPRTASLDWSAVVPAVQWAAFRPVLETANEEGPRFALGGGLAFSAYTGRARNTKDMDLYVRPADREQLVGILTRLGFEDYFGRERYDRQWIYRGYKDGVLVDLIWQMANYRTQVDAVWVTRGPTIALHDVPVPLLAPEELLWSKLYVVQRERCDWPDLLNILRAVGPELDFEHLLGRVGDDSLLLGGLLNVFGWLCPNRARELPRWLWKRVGLRPPLEGPSCNEDKQRIRLLDSRDWFGAEEDGWRPRSGMVGVEDSTNPYDFPLEH